MDIKSAGHKSKKYVFPFKNKVFEWVIFWYDNRGLFISRLLDILLRERGIEGTGGTGIAHESEKSLVCVVDVCVNARGDTGLQQIIY